MTRTVAAYAALLTTLACSTGEPSTIPGSGVSQLPDPSASHIPSAATHDSVVAAVQRLFDALATGDVALLRATMDSSVVMQFTETRDGQTTFGSSTLDGLAERIVSGDAPLIERMWNPTVLVSGSMATLWTPYDFYVGEAFSHCGVDSATLMRRAVGWIIVGLSWTRLQPPDCPLHPEGPPTL